MTERAPGELERDVMEVLWGTASPLSAREIFVKLEQSTQRVLARSTVLTVLSRLEKKERIVRRRENNVFMYSASASREEYTAELMRDVLARSADRSAALAHFVNTTESADLNTLRAILHDIDSR